ncbi:MAG: putative FAD-binding dehydrogenase [Planctomycetes bacterium ADurb.Bin126]|nr:MAG: putative FAD-binding dehydrogenase [Planctomycetes bacterium ADurb.Bin126]HOD83118.1 FAD-dependent oxidoreductase [Phycisphaerae bacterium]HQL72465.1 FAD-dependent oxidoreductase [Phycisphaerae bacterium]
MARTLPRRRFLQSVSAAAVAAPLGAAAAQQASPPASPAVVAEPPRQTPVAWDGDVCVVGGSCTGVSAAVSAARMGAKVAIVELNGFFGGVATAGLVSMWHSLKDRPNKKDIIAGTTLEILERLRKREGVRGGGNNTAIHTELLKLELDKMIVQAGVRPFLHAMMTAAVVEDGRVTAVIIEDKSGRRAIRARVFVDATGDADLIARAGLEHYRREVIQPPTMCCILRGINGLKKRHKGFNVHQAIFDKKYNQAIEKGFSWSAPVPGDCGCPDDAGVVGPDDLTMLAGTRVFGADCSDADQLTRAELEGRRQVDHVCELLREHFMGGKGLPLVALPARIGVRETRHARCLHCLTADELVAGKRFDDAIANGTYRIDVHNAKGAGVKFRDIQADFYQIPYKSLVPKASKNVLVAGRSLDADEQAFGAVRVMVNCNQMGQAAGVAAALALEGGANVAGVEAAKLRAALARQGAIVL